MNDLIDNNLPGDDKDFVEWYLDKFYYVDWSEGDDDKLRVGDYLVAFKENSFTSEQTEYVARIEMFDNGIPAFIINEEPDEEETGRFSSIFEAFLNGYEFMRINKEEWAMGVKAQSTIVAIF